ncbi:hypothetical protein JZ751_000533 [Albula glossodonta]|uniref:Uncharacterized protein n=1 Tax=Albula glossodonta TaxID=121402 RepID=A0A8T2PWH6_9TELE|nr:hypothetical protein JZ751_000533 [Albula glossodonta]
MNMKVVFGHPFSIAWLSPLTHTNMLSEIGGQDRDPYHLLRAQTDDAYCQRSPH